MTRVHSPCGLIPTCSVVAIAACLLAACQPATSTEGPSLSPAPKSTASETVALPYGFAKFCDLGRAVYVQNGVKESAVAIVENAPECAPSGAREQGEGL